MADALHKSARVLANVDLLAVPGPRGEDEELGAATGSNVELRGSGFDVRYVCDAHAHLAPERVACHAHDILCSMAPGCGCLVAFGREQHGPYDVVVEHLRLELAVRQKGLKSSLLLR
eukprot:CAMPEP_0206010302 /NCGR_PEP_ID=MMETSP1464-20131121/11350_1 /ASSEMBLY_ACC=CAM_ASM_001124 /TAXON_ID=119497 /ORGANISM="Exanthemachrysis gayraliae, Strain RCC1523" /LENGTH=116 /DNA_ID=CAMNT_0053383927 /DNA_START=448 /DNA_END=794 /DNA_ORIENTATION=-